MQDEISSGGGAALPDSLRRILNAAGACPGSLWRLPDGGVGASFLPGIELLTGCTAAAYGEDPGLFWRMVPEDEKPLVLQITDANTSAPSGSFEFRLAHRNGGLRWLRMTWAVRSDGRFDVLLIDHTVRKEEELRREGMLEHYRRMVSRDSLTGLLNRAGMKEELERLWNLSRRHPFSIGLLVVDIDHFKAINDTYGHLVGDAVIKECAARAQFLLRDTDTICRYAGDELVAILPWTDLEQTRRIGERLRSEIGAHVFCAGAQDVKLTISIGAHARTPLPSEDVDSFLKRGDQALYRAKQEGRNRLCGIGEPQDQLADGSVPEPVVFDAPTANSKGRILVVDDEAGIRTLLRRILERAGYEVWEAPDIAGALAVVEGGLGSLDLALVDLCIGTEDGLDLIARIKELAPLVMAIVITGNATMDRAVGSMRAGAYDFIRKPFGIEEVTLQVGRAMDQRRLLLENRRYQQHLEAMVRHRGRSLAKALEEQKNAHQYALESMAALIDARERTTGAHCRRVARMAVILAAEMGMPEQELEHIRNGALLHDIGKVAIPDSVLLKPGALTDEEWEIMKTHPRAGYAIIAGNPALAKAAQIILSHHEKYDGSGYPDGMAGEAIDLGARIFSVVDSYDAMRASRRYAGPQAPSAALEEIIRCRGTHYDPDVVDAFVRCQPVIEAELRFEDPA